ncbi:hypothetical protein LINGRAHAP2_LOCUS3732 [Linum grandiflorum]
MGIEDAASAAALESSSSSGGGSVSGIIVNTTIELDHSPGSGGVGADGSAGNGPKSGSGWLRWPGGFGSGRGEAKGARRRNEAIGMSR